MVQQASRSSDMHKHSAKAVPCAGPNQMTACCSGAFITSCVCHALIVSITIVVTLAGPALAMHARVTHLHATLCTTQRTFCAIQLPAETKLPSKAMEGIMLKLSTSELCAAQEQHAVVSGCSMPSPRIVDPGTCLHTQPHHSCSLLMGWLLFHRYHMHIPLPCDPEHSIHSEH